MNVWIFIPNEFIFKTLSIYSNIMNTYITIIETCSNTGIHIQIQECIFKLNQYIVWKDYMNVWIFIPIKRMYIQNVEHIFKYDEYIYNYNRNIFKCPEYVFECDEYIFILVAYYEYGTVMLICMNMWGYFNMYEYGKGILICMNMGRVW